MPQPFKRPSLLLHFCPRVLGPVWGDRVAHLPKLGTEERGTRNTHARTPTGPRLDPDWTARAEVPPDSRHISLLILEKSPLAVCYNTLSLATETFASCNHFCLSLGQSQWMLLRCPLLLVKLKSPQGPMKRRTTVCE